MIFQLNTLKKTAFLFLFGLLIIAITGCSTHQVNIKPDSNLQKTNNQIDLNVHTEAPEKVDSVVIKDLEKYLKAELIVNDFEVVDSANDCINLDVDVHTFTPGNQALRILIGFGAGRGSLIYTAKYMDIEGNILASLKGYERFTGGEVHFNTEYGQMATLKGAEKVQKVLVQEAAKHIVQLGLNNMADLTGEKEATATGPDYP